MKDWEESWKYDAQRSIFDELLGVSFFGETLCRMLDITSQRKWFYQEKLRMQKWAVFHLISKHSLNINFLCIFFMNYWWVWESQIIDQTKLLNLNDHSAHINCEIWPSLETFFSACRRQFLLICLLLNHYTSTVCHSPPQHFLFFISYCSTTILLFHLHYQSVVLHRPVSADLRLFQTSESLKYDEIALSLLWNLQLFGHLSLTDTWGTKK